MNLYPEQCRMTTARENMALMKRVRTRRSVCCLGSMMMRAVVYTAAAGTALVLGFLLIYIVVRGVPNLRLSLFSWTYTSENQSMLPAIINTCTMTVIVLLAAVPVGVGAAIYLTEYARRGSWIPGIVQMATQTLSGIPSIVYGLFGMLMFGHALHLGYSLLCGALTLTIMILPLIMRTTQEALLSVPDAYREGSFGLGAGKLRTVFSVVLPAAMPGILSGVILAIGRIMGETAALIYTSGTVAKAAGLRDSGTTLALHMYRQASEGLYLSEAYATGVVLLALVLVINFCSSKAAHLMVKDRG